MLGHLILRYKPQVSEFFFFSLQRTGLTNPCMWRWLWNILQLAHNLQWVHRRVGGHWYQSITSFSGPKASCSHWIAENAPFSPTFAPISNFRLDHDHVRRTTFHILNYHPSTVVNLGFWSEVTGRNLQFTQIQDFSTNLYTCKPLRKKDSS